MKVTYLAHSGFLLEWENCYWLFDYYSGTLPKLDPRKKLFVFCSHSHRDHFNPAVFSLFEEQPCREYLFSNELKNACKKEQRRHPELKLPVIRFLRAWEDTVVTDGAGKEMKIHTMHSTDCGCAFYLEYDGKTVYHAGDLHWWVWPGEPDEDNRQMTGNYKKEMGYLKGRSIDLAFSPLDPRQEECYDWGADYLLEQAQVRYLFPMHFWDDFSVIPKYLGREKKHPAHSEVIIIEKEGQSWEVEL